MVESLYRIFLGTSTSWILLGEILFRTVFMYLYTLINIRMMGKRSIKQLTGFEFLIVIALGSAVGDPMFMPDVPLIHGMFVITLITLLEIATSWLSEKSAIIDFLTAGKPSIVIRQGKIIAKELKKESIALDELLARLRLKGIKNIGDVEYAFLETSGDLSVIPYEQKSKTGQSTFSALAQQEKK